MRVGRHNRYVALSQKFQESGSLTGPYPPLSPPNWWCSIQPVAPGGGDGRTTLHQVTMRFHSQVTTDTMLTYSDPVIGRDRFLLVLAPPQNVNDGNDELRMVCEEITP